MAKCSNTIFTWKLAKQLLEHFDLKNFQMFLQIIYVHKHLLLNTVLSSTVFLNENQKEGTNRLVNMKLPVIRQDFLHQR